MDKFIKITHKSFPALIAAFFLLNFQLKEPLSPLNIQIKLNDNFNFEKFKQEDGKFYPYEKGVMSFYPIEIEIQNNSDSTIIFWEMTCSWPNNWILSDKKIYLYHGECAQNFPTKQIIEAHKSMHRPGLLFCESGIASQIKDPFKMGLVWVKENEYDVTTDLPGLVGRKKNADKDLVWSNFIKLN